MRRVIGVLVMVLMCAPLALADAPTTGVVTGTVVGPDGAALPGATVLLTGGQGTITAVTGADGGWPCRGRAPARRSHG
jgi:hypothetical protein